MDPLIIFFLQLPLVLIGGLVLLALFCATIFGIGHCFEKKPVISSIVAVIISVVMFYVGHHFNQQRLAGRTMEAGPAPIELESDEF